MTVPSVSLVVPAYNSARYLNGNVLRLVDFFERAGIDGEIVVADDGSTDGTADSVTPGSRVQVLRLPHRGKGAAVRAAMAVTSGDICGFTDALERVRSRRGRRGEDLRKRSADRAAGWERALVFRTSPSLLGGRGEEQPQGRQRAKRHVVEGREVRLHQGEHL